MDRQAGLAVPSKRLQLWNVNTRGVSVCGHVETAMRVGRRPTMLCHVVIQTALEFANVLHLSKLMAGVRLDT